MDTFESKGLATASLLVFSIAIFSQWAFGFYTADYYNSTAPKNLSEHHKGFSQIDFKCGKGS